MSESEIRVYINRLNKGNPCETIFTRPISENVVIAKVWEKQPKITCSKLYDSYTFFFIKNKESRYIAAVLDMVHDLHWYVVPEFRKQGHLTQALKEAILPYIFYSGRDIQLLSINKQAIKSKNYNESKSVAYSVGFKPLDLEETKFKLESSDFCWKFENLCEKDSILTNERFETLRMRVLFAAKTLEKIGDELEIASNDDKGFHEISRKVREFIVSL